jgi:hypothetical protein
VLLVTKAAAGEIVWLDLEDGVQIQFSDGGEYLKGDYWLIPRVSRLGATNGRKPTN